ncbi:arginine/serine-rich protein 1-like isoform X2 [Seriola lalandi dorsalis]|uniref:arginine/serine-rich protein 1-like isoform X2 n=1 Tax=Seriola lalandi dorsalis TaxID=1841481 RepID=UPI000C6F5F06|nr:arginine/serine-rich protein 1-like isoform X2 [Seriola lalandi dorsalis]XP_056249199.1 arginine/serine-rich protein 1 isoform X2 [Seriola aureovittata]
MTKGEDSHSEMAHARQSDGINVIFDQNSPASSRSQSQSSSGSRQSSGSACYRGRGSHRGRSSSSSSSTSRSRSSSRPRSRSHPRCHRRSSRCGCDNHRRYGHGRHRRSPPRRYRAHSRSYSRSPVQDRSPGRTRYRSRSRSPSRLSRHRRTVSQFRSRFSKSPARGYRSRSRSTSSGHLSLDDKREPLEAAKANALNILGVEKLELPESVKPIPSEKSTESRWVSPEPETRIPIEGLEVFFPSWTRCKYKSNETEPDDVSNLKMSPKRKIISFSINNSVAKPTTVAPSCAKVTPRVDSYESRKPYGHWVPVKSGRSSSARKHTLTKAH